jgi:hypothetical protein
MVLKKQRCDIANVLLVVGLARVGGYVREHLDSMEVSHVLIANSPFNMYRKYTGQIGLDVPILLEGTWVMSRVGKWVPA